MPHDSNGVGGWPSAFRRRFHVSHHSAMGIPLGASPGQTCRATLTTVLWL